ncbi:MAG: hypothetical protein MJ152_00025, partial [Clostridia bacterium]|nr:hypothetical protein [Clostridia bacterium]
MGHTTHHIDGQASTCSEHGWKDYYQCDRCEKYFEDEVGNKLIGDATALEAWKQNAGKIEKLPHTLVLVEGQPATCTEDGWTDCYKCSVCGEYCADESGKVVIGDETDYNNWKVGNGKIKASGHALELVEGKPATCTETGWKDYYHCVVEGCDKFFEDSKGTTEITDLPSWKVNDGKIETIAHNPVYVEGQESTCQEHGWYHYYQCSMCNKYFEDENGTTPIEDLDAWKVNAGKVEATG